MVMEELSKRPERPIPAMCEDAATLEGLVDLLIVGTRSHPEGFFTEDEFVVYINRYHSVMTALVMILIEKGHITQEEMEKAISAFHYTIRTAPPNASGLTIMNMRRDRLREVLAEERV